MEFMHNPNQIAVFSEDGETLAEVTFPEVEEGVVDVDHTYVSGELRGQGIAGKLMSELVKDLAETDRKLSELINNIRLERNEIRNHR